jgi:hypothetical protein
MHIDIRHVNFFGKVIALVVTELQLRKRLDKASGCSTVHKSNARPIGNHVL